MSISFDHLNKLIKSKFEVKEVVYPGLTVYHLPDDEDIEVTVDEEDEVVYLSIGFYNLDVKEYSDVSLKIEDLWTINVILDRFGYPPLEDWNSISE